jgi:heme exporter protein B
MRLYLTQLWAVAWKDLVVELRGRERIGAMAGFTALAGVLFNFAIDWTLVRADDVISALVWMTVVFGGTLGIGRTFELEAGDGAFQGVLLTPAPRDALYLGKVVSNYLIVMAVVLLVLLVFGLFFHVDWTGRLPLTLLTLALGTLGFVAVGTLFAAVTAGTKLGSNLLPLLLFPLLTPVVIYGTSTTGRLLAGRPVSEVEGQLRMLGAFALLAVFAGAVLFRFVVED